MMLKIYQLIYTKYLLIIIIIGFLTYQNIYAQNQCRKSFVISGTTHNGTKSKDTIVTQLFFDDLTEEQRNELIDDEASKYKGYDYVEVVGTRTKKQNCAGYVTNKLWGIGQYVINATSLYKNIFKKYSSPLSLTDKIQTNHVVVYGEGNHFAIVKTADENGIYIETKDNKEALYIHKLDWKSISDPMVDLYGTPQFLRINQNNVSISPLYPGVKCDKDKKTARVTIEIIDERREKPDKNDFKWIWALKFTEHNGVGVTLNKCHTIERTSTKLKKDAWAEGEIRIEGSSSFIQKNIYLHYENAPKSGGSVTVNWTYYGTDDFGTEVEVPFNIKRSTPKLTK